jgi:hypothetical protein
MSEVNDMYCTACNQSQSFNASPGERLGEIPVENRDVHSRAGVLRTAMKPVCLLDHSFCVLIHVIFPSAMSCPEETVLCPSIQFFEFRFHVQLLYMLSTFPLC